MCGCFGRNFQAKKNVLLRTAFGWSAIICRQRGNTRDSTAIAGRFFRAKEIHQVSDTGWFLNVMSSVRCWKTWCPGSTAISVSRSIIIFPKQMSILRGIPWYPWLVFRAGVASVRSWKTLPPVMGCSEPGPHWKDALVKRIKEVCRLRITQVCRAKFVELSVLQFGRWCAMTPQSGGKKGTHGHG